MQAAVKGAVYVPDFTKHARWQEIMTKLTLRYVRKRGAPVVHYNFKINKNYVILPRGTANVLVDNGILAPLSAKYNTWDAAAVSVRPNAIQAPILVYLASIYARSNIEAGRALCTLNLMAGQGKTYVAIGVIGQVKPLRCLYVIPNTTVLLQTMAALEQYTNYVVNNSKSQAMAERQIDVLCINTACKIDTRQYDLIVLDEVHEYCTPSKSAIFWRLSVAVLALSATTAERDDGFDKIYYQHIGKPLHADTIPGVKYEDISWNIQCTVINYCGPDEFTANLRHESTDEIFVQYMLNQFMNDPHRRALSRRYTLELYNEGHNVYVFAMERAHAEAIYADLTAHIPAAHVTTFMGGDGDRPIADDVRIVVATYGFAGTGLSIPRMTAIVFDAPRKAKMKQICARILRTGYRPDMQRRIVDIVDYRTCLRHQLKKRLIAYDLYGATITYVNVSSEQ